MRIFGIIRQEMMRVKVINKIVKNSATPEKCACNIAKTGLIDLYNLSMDFYWLQQQNKQRRNLQLR